MVKILCEENTSTLGNCSHKNMIGEAGLAVSIDTLNSEVTDGYFSGDAVAYTIKQ